MKRLENIRRSDFDAVLFDMDGVVTDTAAAHASAWKALFDAFLEKRAADENTEFVPFDPVADYRSYVDGKPRYDGVRSFLAARGIELPEGSPGDDEDRETICGLGNRKDHFFNDWLASNRVRVFPGTVEFVHALRDAGIRVAIFSASRNMTTVLENAGVRTLFDAHVDGTMAAELGLPGKPDPAVLERAAHELGLEPERCLVVEDAIAGVTAGAAGDFAGVIGIDREDYADALYAHGADLVVNDLAELRVGRDGSIAAKRIAGLPGIRASEQTLATLADARRLAILLDYDGTLTPIVSDYRKAQLNSEMRQTLARLASRHRVAVISGRGLDDVRQLVGLDTLYYSGSHGFELAGPGDYHHVHEQAAGFLPDLDAAEAALSQALKDIPGHAVERKQFSIAVHYRQVDDSRVRDVADAVDRVVRQSGRLVKGLGKKVFELKPALAWDKGRAVELLLERLGLQGKDALAIYVGDDITDEAAFCVLRPPNLSIIVDGDDRVTAADFSLRDCDEVRRFLDHIANLP